MQTDEYLCKIEPAMSVYGYQWEHHDILHVNASFIYYTNAAKIYIFIKIL